MNLFQNRNEEIAKWCNENLEMEDMDSAFADINNYHTGNDQGGEDCKEWCDQTCLGEDWYGEKPEEA